MQIIVDIPEEAYNLLQNEGVDWLGAEHILDAVSKGTPIEESNDCVSREAAIKAICRYCTPKKPERCPTAEICHSYQELKALPPVTPTEKVGHWTEGGFDFNYWVCSKCEYQPNNDYSKPSYNYCPNCGAKMQG